MKIQISVVALVLLSSCGCSDSQPKPAVQSGGQSLPAGGFVDKTAGGEKAGKAPAAQAGEGGAAKKFD